MNRLKTMSTVTTRIALVLVFIISLQSCHETIEPMATGSNTISASNLNQAAISIRPSTLSTTTGFQGRVFNGSFQTIPNAVITFSNASGIYVAICDAYGTFKIALDAGSYYSSCTANGYQSYFSSPGVGVVTGNDGFRTYNFFLSNPQVMGFGGGVYNASTFAHVQNATISYIKSNDPTLVFSTFSPNGFYSVDLPQLGGYYAKVSALGYTSYDSTPGTYVLNSSGFHTANFFLNP
ncbi:MAG: hypothetical protein HYR67_07820 [Bacteroidetes bacterium]|nr:hypothetical protein [Bacteroidota bacterium]